MRRRRSGAFSLPSFPPFFGVAAVAFVVAVSSSFSRAAATTAAAPRGGRRGSTTTTTTTSSFAPPAVFATPPSPSSSPPSSSSRLPIAFAAAGAGGGGGGTAGEDAPGGSRRRRSRVVVVPRFRRRRRRPSSSSSVLLATTPPPSPSSSSSSSSVSAIPLRGGGDDADSFSGLPGSSSSSSPPPSSSAAAAVVEPNLPATEGGGSVEPSAEEEEEEREKEGAAPAFSSSSSSSSSRSTIVADDRDFVRPLPDKRSYRAISLKSNGLLCLLASDPRTDVEAGSVHLRTGHFDDPTHRAGLAHFHEHMLFLGTEKYPGEDEYEKFLGRNGGSSNAYTDMEDTNYYFSVAPLDHEEDEDEDVGGAADAGGEEVEEEGGGGVSNALSGALDRFAQFFVSPLFREEMVEREMRAIDSEHLNSVTSDAWRGYSLLKSGSDPDHPFHKFGCGNYRTLSNGGDVEGTSASSAGGSSPRPDLLRFWEDHYAASNMRLCVVGKASLDELQEAVEDTFGEVRSRPPVREEEGEEDGEGKPPEEVAGDDAEAAGSSSTPSPPEPFFPTEHANVHRKRSHGRSPAFPPSRLGILREVVPVIESRSIKISFGFPPLDDPVLIKGGRPHRAISHLLGHESPGSLHDVLNEEGYINGLSSGVGVDCSDFSLFTLTLSLTPRGMNDRSRVLDLVFQWISLIRSTVEGGTTTTTTTSDAAASDDVAPGDRDDVVAPTMERYHDELRRISDTNFRYRENGDPTDFASRASGALFDYEPSRALVGASKCDEYDPIVARELIKRLDAKNALIAAVGPDFEAEDEAATTAAVGEDGDEEKKEEKEERGERDDDAEEFTARDAEWRTERWYGARYRERPVPDRFVSRWSSKTGVVVDERLKLPALNQFIPSDFSLRCDDDDEEEKDAKVIKAAGKQEERGGGLSSEQPPAAIVDRPGLRTWHKLDRTWRVPKTSMRVHLTSSNVYESPRSMTLNRLYQRVLNDDLNSFVYDAGMAGCNYRVMCVPTGYRISVSGYSEKLPLLLDVVTTRMLTLISEMKQGPSAHPGLSSKFDKALHNLLRETKNYRLDSPYEVASYNSRMTIEEHVWHVDDYINEMEGPDAEREPLTMEECARAAEECLTGRVKAEALCIGNIDKTQTLRVADTISDHFLSKSRPLSEDETPSSRSYRLPTRKEAVRIFGDDVSNASIPTVVEELAFGDEENNSAAQVIYQIGCEHELGYEGVATLELLSHIAYNSAFARLRTKEQLGYIVGANSRRTAGGSWSLSVVVQSGIADPAHLERRIESWLSSFRDEIESMPESRIAMEANAVVAQLTERDSKLSDEIGRYWGEILSVETKGSRMRSPAFDRLERLADELAIDEVDDDDSAATETLVDRDGEPRPPRTAALLKRRLLGLFDERLAADAPERRALSTRVYGRKFGDLYEANKGKPGVLSSYDDVRHVKRYLSTWPNAPYWA